eukprot:TRINITY_DN37920_c0_g1_i2.p1 TRINITY_DN37920_c0_g1~~TRINITY_DN37920_c0_g1_i2.p1  ORF type:complete len:447 (-),score=50.14 TRINITY_DN37920_c0_g1_i2:142-1482(-)
MSESSVLAAALRSGLSRRPGGDNVVSSKEGHGRGAHKCQRAPPGSQPGWPGGSCAADSSSRGASSKLKRAIRRIVKVRGCVSNPIHLEYDAVAGQNALYARNSTYRSASAEKGLQSKVLLDDIDAAAAEFTAAHQAKRRRMFPASQLVQLLRQGSTSSFPTAAQKEARSAPESHAESSVLSAALQRFSRTGTQLVKCCSRKSKTSSKAALAASCSTGCSNYDAGASMNSAAQEVNDISSGKARTESAQEPTSQGYLGSVDLSGYRLIVGTDCSGMETPLHALTKLGVNVKHAFSSESNSAARHVIEANYSPSVMYSDACQRDNATAPACDLYIAGFPCQPFSTLGKRQAFDDVAGRGTVVFACLDYIAHHLPKAFVLENVAGFKTACNGACLESVLGRIEKMQAYNVHYEILDTKQHGIPQSRRRLYIILIRTVFLQQQGQHLKAC